jgi:hypothetical protein
LKFVNAHFRGKEVIEGVTTIMAGKPIAGIYTSEHVISHKHTLREGIRHFVQGTWHDFKLTNQSTAGHLIKFGAGALVVRGAVANEMGGYTPLRWVVRGFGPLPAEFTKSGAIQVFEYTGLERLKVMAISTASKFVLVTVAYEGGVLIGSMINQAIPDKTQDAIGGTIDEIINHGGWKDLWRHPFGIGM